MGIVTAEQFLEKLGKGKAGPVVLLLGSDLYWRDLCRAALIEAFVPEGARQWAVTRFSLGEDSLERVLAQAQTLPMLAPRQVVFAEELDALERRSEEAREAAMECLAAYLGDAAPSTLLVLEAAQLDQRMKLYRLLSEKAFVVELGAGEEAGAREVAELARGLGVAIDRDAAALLAEILAGQMARIRVELEKLAVYVGERKRIASADITELVLSAKTYSVWELAEILATGPRSRALAFLDSLLREGEAPPKLLGALAWMYRKLLEAQELPAHLSPWQVARQLGMRPETAELALRQARKLAPEKLRSGLVALAEADSRLKSGGTSDRAVMEFLVAQLTAEAAPSARPRVEDPS